MFQSIPVAVGAYANNETIAGVAATPGWNVITEFQIDTLPSQGALLDGIVLVSGAALTCRFRLYDVTGAAAVAGSTLSSTSLTGERKTSADLTSALVATRRYQIQAECTGGAAPTDWAVVRYATLISSP